MIQYSSYTNDTPATDLTFDKVPFWVQVHDIPISFQTRKMVERLCETEGEIQKSNGAVENDGGSFFSGTSDGCCNKSFM